MSDMNYILDLIIVGGGIYMVYGALALKRGIITASILLPRNVTEDKIKDKPGFIAAVFLKLLILGIVTTLAGLVIMVNDIYSAYAWVNVVCYLFFFIAVVVYGIAIKKAHKKFL